MHNCPNCQQACDCDEDDLWHEGDSPKYCGHLCDDPDPDGDEEFYAEPEGLDMPCTGAFTCPCRQCVRELGP